MNECYAERDRTDDDNDDCYRIVHTCEQVEGHDDDHVCVCGVSW